MAAKGDFWAVAKTVAVIGQKVFAVIADGTIKTGAAGAAVAGAVETDFKVVTAGAIGELIIISTAPYVPAPPVESDS